ncbi:DUF3833 domain-containing protein [Marinobacterium jannaschii]|uniref:DUF3833 domain-containing protein n=1 Tax=Marinobacterium jannaschii TaxID=64970 RepID=UPI000A05FA99|nr:DUF3833 domain-containing protein [Marinobacterium jannaschii]
MVIVIGKRVSLCVLLILSILSGCTPMNVEQFSGRSPTLLPEEYFDGRVMAWGIFEDRFGTLRREFRVDIDGRWDGQTLLLKEYFSYSDGEKQRRIWTIRPQGNGRYSGTAPDIVGAAAGLAAGNALNWRYQMDLKVGDREWRVRFNDWMFLQPDGSLINRAKVSKWGLGLGEVTLFFMREDNLSDQMRKRFVL